MTSIHDPDGRRLPIKMDSTSNGEFEPIPLGKAEQIGNALAHEAATANAKRLGQSRRKFLVSACGAASTLLAFNAAQAAMGRSGGTYALAPEAALEEEAAEAVLAGDEFIVDVQGHFVNPNGAWLDRLPGEARPLSGFENAGCTLGTGDAPRAYLQCFGPDAFVKDVFMDSDTDIMVLSFVPSTREGEPLTIEEPRPRAPLSISWKEPIACCCMAGSIPIRPAMSKTCSACAMISASRPGRPTPSGDLRARVMRSLTRPRAFDFLMKPGVWTCR